MDLRYTHYLSTDSNFYKPNQGATLEDFHELEIQNCPKDWIISESDDSYWKYVLNKRISMPIQGWKIHISSNVNELQEVLDVVAPLLFEMNISFKYVSKEWDYFETNSKYGDRSGSGKFITIYPPTNEIFENVLIKLKEVLINFKKGPYILSDERWENTNIFFRYGGFISIKNSDGELCILDENGQLIPDVRAPHYNVPNFVKIPSFIKKMETEMFRDNSDIGNLSRYNIKSAIHFSNGGGVYQATNKETKKNVILKEGRPNAGLDTLKKDAFSRNENEFNILKQLSDIEEIVDVYDYFQAWENNYLVEEEVNGDQLNTWIAINYPFFEKSQKNVTKYKKNALSILCHLEDALNIMHQRNIAIVDLSPMNVIVNSENNNVKLIDFECAGMIDEEYRPALLTPGFSINNVKNRKQQDLFALLRIAIFLFYPGANPQDLNFASGEVINNWIKNNFGDDVFSEITKLEIQTVSSIPQLKKLIDNTSKNTNLLIEEDLSQKVSYLTDKLYKGLIDNMNFENENLIGGDIRQYEEQGGKLSVLYGSFGVLLALLRTKKEIPQDVEKWLTKYTTDGYINKMSIGLLNGKTGVAGVLYELGEREKARKILKNVQYEDCSNISLYSGLSGIGIEFLSIGIAENDESLIEKSKEVASKVIQVFRRNKKIKSIDWDFIDAGLIDGWSGAALFLVMLYRHTNDKKWLEWSEKCLDEDLKNCSTDENGILQVDDKTRYLPYLLGGSIGIAFSLNELSKDSTKAEYKGKLQEIAGIKNSRCCYNPGLFRGYTGFVLFNQLLNKVEGRSNMSDMRRMLDTLKINLIQKEDGILVPGDYGYRFSGDVFSGASGVLMTLSNINSENWFHWLPIPQKALNNLLIERR